MSTDTVELDNLAAGDDVATDLITSRHFQQVKLVDPTVGSETPVGFGAGTEAAALRVTLPTDCTGVLSVDDNGGSLTVDGTVTANLSATDNAVLDTIDAVLDAINAKLVSGTVIGDVNLGATDNAVLDSIDTSLNNIEAAVGGTQTDDAAFTLGTGEGVMMMGYAGTQSVDSGDAGVVAMETDGTLHVGGPVAHDAAASGALPFVGGARATNSVEGLTQVANADASYVASDLNGVLLSRPHTTPEEHISERISNTNGTSTDFTNFAAGGAGIHNYVTDITVLNTSATDGYVDIRDGSAGSVIWTLPLPAGGGATHSFSLPLKGAANTAIAYDVSAALTTVYISVNGFQAQG